MLLRFRLIQLFSEGLVEKEFQMHALLSTNYRRAYWNIVRAKELAIAKAAGMSLYNSSMSELYERIP